MSGLPFTVEGNDIRLAVRVTPRARRTEVIGLVAMSDGRTAVAIKLAAAPVDGAANQALIDYLARALGVPRSAIRLISGEKSRLKLVAITGLSEVTVAQWVSGFRS